MASIGDGADDAKGRRFSSDEVFPVTTDRIRQAGARSLIVTDEWQKKNEGTPFHNIMVHETKVDDSWLDDWHAATDIDESAHHRLVVTDDIYPITLFINKETGRIGKLSTMEWDVTYGDVRWKSTMMTGKWSTASMFRAVCACRLAAHREWISPDPT